MPRGRPDGSKSTRPVRFGDLKEHLKDDQVIMVGHTWLKNFEEFMGVRFVAPDSPPVKRKVPEPETLQGGTEKEAEVRERLPKPKPEKL